MTWLLNALLGLIPKFILDWLAERRAAQAERDAGRAEEQNRSRQEAEKAEAKGEKAAEQAAKTPVDEPDEFMRRD